MFSYFEKGITNLIPSKTIDLAQLVKLIKTNPKQSLVNEIRELRLKRDQTYKKKKTFLNYITPNCSVKKRSLKEEEDYTKNFIAPSSYIYFDFDDVVNVQEFKKYFIEKYGHLVSLVCLSSGAGGISVLFKITNIIDNNNFYDIWEIIKTTYFKEEQVDIKCKNIGRAMYLPYDTEPFVNYENEITVAIPLNKEKNNPSKRIEYRGENVRVSRTGGVSATKTFKGDGVGATINTKHGLRLHKRLFKGARMGFQNGNFQFIGRYNSGPFNFNVSKNKLV